MARPEEEGLSKNHGNALDALDLVINVLKEHEKELDKLVNELKKLIEKLSALEGLAKRIGGLEEKLSMIEAKAKLERAKLIEEKPPLPQGPLLMLRFKSWEEFREAAQGSEIASYFVRKEDEEELIQVEALKGRMLLTYVGPIPDAKPLIKSWLSGELEVPRQNIFEGFMRGVGESRQAAQHTY
ncbi:MAG: hypothetical protein N3H31_02230 [Candidatus Nezhaarchaeota archaeon]|nr:hypothetical protein [Candidatus Nezhaarchaeota archaeon]